MRHLDTPWIISKVYRWTSFQLQTGNCQWPTGHVQTQQHVRIRRVYNECIYIYTYTHTHVNVRFKPSIIIHHLQSIHHISINIHQIRSHPSSMTRTDHLGHGARHGLGLARQAPCGVLPGAGREICCGFQRFRWIPSASFKGLLWCMDFYGFLWVSIGILCISMIHDFFQGWIYCFFSPGMMLFPSWGCDELTTHRDSKSLRCSGWESKPQHHVAGLPVCATSQSDTNWCHFQNTATYLFIW